MCLFETRVLISMGLFSERRHSELEREENQMDLREHIQDNLKNKSCKSTVLPSLGI